VGLPSDLLQRRPDIAAAERELAAYNAEIGVATAAYFPTIQLTGALGFNTSDLSTLANGTSSVWSVGASLFQQVFNAGRIGLNVDRTKALYQERVALYQGVLLRAFQEVETSLAGLRFLTLQSAQQQAAVTSANRGALLATKRYSAGLVSLMDVVIAQRMSLEAESEAVQIANNQLLTSVALIKALGGGWRDRRPSERAAKLVSPSK
jgi:NodT family efflux transporter outer membrane factor (OMF) lipoprotein